MAVTEAALAQDGLNLSSTSSVTDMMMVVQCSAKLLQKVQNSELWTATQLLITFGAWILPGKLWTLVDRFAASFVHSNVRVSYLEKKIASLVTILSHIYELRC